MTMPGVIDTSVEDAEGEAEVEARLGLSSAVLDVLVENHARFLVFLERRVGDRDLAEEILQQAFVRGIAGGGSLRQDESAVAWFYRVMRNALTDHFRHRGAEHRALLAVAAEPAPDATSPDEELLQTACDCVRHLIATLKPEYARAIERVDLEGEPVPGYAAESGITINNAGVRLHRAREALRRQVEKSCGICASHGCLDCHCGPAMALRAPRVGSETGPG